ncbi:hypothetical protein [Salegentibacter chungangensis]|uniref:Alpha/beta hydrolase n=1 Tax=Salegentibacter chungangensis TaxID=1335724 RepID=A0ABW3NQT4_9FLAO
MSKRARIFSILFSFCFFVGFAQEMRLSKGSVVDSIPVSDSLSESFAIYLPHQFREDSNWPVIFVFDPEGRGKSAARLLKDVAEDQSYIIVATNENLKEDSLQANLAKASRMMNTVFNALPVDLDQVYAMGLEEGGIVASAIPLVYKKTRGVLAIGAAWVNPEFVEKSRPYMFSIASGYQDSDQFELLEITKIYEEEDYPVEFNYFEGNSEEWPSAGFMNAAVSGLSFRAVSEGLRKNDPAYVKALYENELEFAESLRRKQRYLKAYEKLEQIEEKYETFEDETREMRKNLRRTSLYRQQKRDYRQAREEENYRKDLYYSSMGSDLVTQNFENVGWWAYQMDQLKKLQEKGNPAQQEMAHRLEGFLDSLSQYHYNTIHENKASIDTKILVSILRTVINKEDPEAYLNIIRLSGNDGDYETALLYLEDLLKTGYEDMESLYEIPGILDLKFSKEYNELIFKYLGKSKYYEEALN